MFEKLFNSAPDEMQEKYQNKWEKENTFKLTIKKITGTVNTMVPTDHLMLRMPKELNVEGDSIFYRGSGSMSGLAKRDTITYKDSVDTQGVRYVRLPMPINEYNAAANKGVGAEITCHVPVKYIPNGHSRAPVQELTQGTLVSPDPRVVGNPSILERDVEINPHQNFFVFYILKTERFQFHPRPLPTCLFPCPQPRSHPALPSRHRHNRSIAANDILPYFW